MDDIRYFYNEYRESFAGRIFELAERFTESTDEEPILKFIYFLTVIVSLFLVFLTFLSLCLAIGCMCLFLYFFMAVLAIFMIEFLQLIVTV